MDAAPQIYRARWLLPVDGEPIADGVLEVHAGVIRHCGPTPADQRHLPLQNVAILPQFINAHTHLEFSELASPLGTPGDPFREWIPRVVAWRRERDADAAVGAARRSRAIHAGLDECTRCQVAAVGEIATTSDSMTAIQSRWDSGSGVAAVVFQELLGLSPARVTECLIKAREVAIASRECSPGWRQGLSPHAPYTVHRELLAGIVRLARENRLPLAMHLAESREELQLLADGTGPMVTMLEELGVWNPDAYRGYSRPLDYLQTLAEAEQVLVVHGNYLSPEERSFLAEHRDRLSLVYCPRTHAYFRHDPYPLRDLLDRGVEIAVGTDSRASNPDLDLLEELRTVLRFHGDVSPAEVLRMGTLAGATALGLADRLGSLQPGKRAALQWRELPSDRFSDPYSWL